jgi:hypothetical protein
MCMIIEFAPIPSQPELQCSQCRKIYHLAEVIKIDLYNDICKRCFQIISSDMNEIFGNNTHGQEYNFHSQNLSYGKH